MCVMVSMDYSILTAYNVFKRKCYACEEDFTLVHNRIHAIDILYGTNLKNKKIVT